MPLRQLRLSLAHGLRHNSGTAGAHHEARRAGDDQQGHDQVDGREGSLPGKIGHEYPIYHAVDGRKNHHDNGREGEAQELPVRKVLGQLDPHTGSFSSFSDRFAAKASRKEAQYSSRASTNDGPYFFTAAAMA